MTTTFLIIGFAFAILILLSAASGTGTNTSKDDSDGSEDSSSLLAGTTATSLFSDDDWESTTSGLSLLDDDNMGCGSINPASGLPMVGCLDIEGNAYGTSSSSFDDSSSLFDDSSSSLFDDTFSSSIFDDSFSS